MRLLSWNVNGIRSALGKGLKPIVDSHEYDMLMFQEVKTDSLPLGVAYDPYTAYLFDAKARRGYSGVMTLTKRSPINVIYGIGLKKFDAEGRVITLEMPAFYVINAYFPNSRRDLSRLDFKIEFDRAFSVFADGLRKKKPVIICGDFNVAHEERDIARPKENEENAGFTRRERAWFTRFVRSGYTDAYRMFVSAGGNYTWWTYRFGAREKNIGWRIDYFLVSNDLCGKTAAAGILNNIKGSDHAPIYLELR